jgi:tRNA(adenine34) deaminase
MTNTLHKQWMQQALGLADIAREQGEVPVGAIVVQHGKVVGSGHNVRESNQDPCGHAELIAIRQAAQSLGSWRLEECTVYTTLEPCLMCAGAMVAARIAKCVYGCADPKAGFVGSLADMSSWPGLNHHFEVVSGVCEEACSTLLKEFFRELRQR